jgi:hypothetical protein
MKSEKKDILTLQKYFNWFKENWPKTGVVVSIFLTIYLTIIVLPNNVLLFALLMSAPLYIIHEVDEYVFPGGFAQFMNKNIYKLDPKNGMLDTDAVFWINMIAVWIAIPLFSLWAVFDISQAIALPYFFIFQAVVHLILGIIGKRFIHPGMVTAWLVHVPWGIWTIWLLVKNGIINNPYWNGDLILGLLLNFALLFVGGLLMIRYRRKQRKMKV